MTALFLYTELMIRILLLLVALMPFSVMAQSFDDISLEDVNAVVNTDNGKPFLGDVLCKVVDQQIVELKDGKPERFTHWTDSVQVGDDFSFIVEYETDLNPSFKLTPAKEYNSVDIAIGVSGYAKYVERDGKSNYIGYSDIPFDTTLYSDGNIEHKSVWGDFYSERYYKDDYQMVYSRANSLNSFQLYLNCPKATALTTGLDRIFDFLQRREEYKKSLLND